MKTTSQIPLAAELMNNDVEVVTPELTLIELIDFLQRHHISSAPVVDGNDSSRKLVGFISESDALERLANEMFYGLTEQPSTVLTCMKRHPVCIRPDIDVFAIASLLVNHGYRHMPVVDEQNRLLGIVSRRDVLRSMRSFYAKSTKEHESKYFPPDLSKIINHRFILSS